MPPFGSVPPRLSAEGEADSPDGHRYNKQLQVMEWSQTRPTPRSRAREDVGTYFRSTRKNDYSYAGKTVPKGPHPLLPPPRIDKAVPASVLLEEKKLCEGSHLKKRWLHFVLNIEQKDRVFAVLKSGVGNTNVLLQFSCMLCKSCWSSF